MAAVATTPTGGMMLEEFAFSASTIASQDPDDAFLFSDSNTNTSAATVAESVGTTTVDEEQVEALLSAKLMDGFRLLDQPCPKCMVPLIKLPRNNETSTLEDALSAHSQKGDASTLESTAIASPEDQSKPDDDDGTNEEASRCYETARIITAQSLEKVMEQRKLHCVKQQPIKGLPFCVTCESYVVTKPSESRLLGKLKTSDFGNGFLSQNNNSTSATAKSSSLSSSNADTIPLNPLESPTATATTTHHLSAVGEAVMSINTIATDAVNTHSATTTSSVVNTSSSFQQQIQSATSSLLFRSAKNYYYKQQQQDLQQSVMTIPTTPNHNNKNFSNRLAGKPLLERLASHNGDSEEQGVELDIQFGSQDEFAGILSMEEQDDNDDDGDDEARDQPEDDEEEERQDPKQQQQKNEDRQINALWNMVDSKDMIDTSSDNGNAKDHAGMTSILVDSSVDSAESEQHQEPNLGILSHESAPTENEKGTMGNNVVYDVIDAEDEGTEVGYMEAEHMEEEEEEGKEQPVSPSPSNDGRNNREDAVSLLMEALNMNEYSVVATKSKDLDKSPTADTEESATLEDSGAGKSKSIEEDYSEPQHEQKPHEVEAEFLKPTASHDSAQEIQTALDKIEQDTISILEDLKSQRSAELEVPDDEHGPTVSGEQESSTGSSTGSSSTFSMVDEDVMQEYTARREIATKVLGNKMLQGYTLRECQCDQCGMPKMEYNSIVHCVVCPVLARKAKKELKKCKKMKEQKQLAGGDNDDAEDDLVSGVLKKMEAVPMENPQQKHPTSFEPTKADTRFEEAKKAAVRQKERLTELNTKKVAQKETEIQEIKAVVEQTKRKAHEGKVTVEEIKAKITPQKESKESETLCVASNAPGNIELAEARRQELAVKEQNLLEEARAAKKEAEASRENESFMSTEQRHVERAKRKEDAKVAEEILNDELQLIHETKRLEIMERMRLANEIEFKSPQESSLAILALQEERKRLRREAKRQKERRIQEEARKQAELQIRLAADERRSAQEAAMIESLENEAKRKAKEAEDAIAKAKAALEEVNTAKHDIIAQVIAQGEADTIAETEALVRAEAEDYQQEQIVPSASYVLRERWETLRLESRSVMTRRLIAGWTMLPRYCVGSECENSPLLAKDGQVECVVCGGCGTGNDGTYLYMAEDADVEEDPAGEAFPEVAKGVSTLQTKQPTETHAAFPSPQVDEVNEEFEEKRQRVGKEIGKRMLQGWTLLDMSCPNCVMPLLTDEDGENEICVLCGVVGQLEPENTTRQLKTTESVQSDAYSVQSYTDQLEQQYQLGMQCGLEKDGLQGLKTAAGKILEEKHAQMKDNCHADAMVPILDNLQQEVGCTDDDIDNFKVVASQTRGILKEQQAILEGKFKDTSAAITIQNMVSLISDAPCSPRDLEVQEACNYATKTTFQQQPAEEATAIKEQANAPSIANTNASSLSLSDLSQLRVPSELDDEKAISPVTKKIPQVLSADSMIPCVDPPEKTASPEEKAFNKSAAAAALKIVKDKGTNELRMEALESSKVAESKRIKSTSKLPSRSFSNNVGARGAVKRLSIDVSAANNHQPSPETPKTPRTPGFRSLSPNQRASSPSPRAAGFRSGLSPRHGHSSIPSPRAAGSPSNYEDLSSKLRNMLAGSASPRQYRPTRSTPSSPMRGNAPNYLINTIAGRQGRHDDPPAMTSSMVFGGRRVARDPEDRPRSTRSAQMESPRSRPFPGRSPSPRSTRSHRPFTFPESPVRKMKEDAEGVTLVIPKDFDVTNETQLRDLIMAAKSKQVKEPPSPVGTRAGEPSPAHSHRSLQGRITQQGDTEVIDVIDLELDENFNDSLRVDTRSKATSHGHLLPSPGETAVDVAHLMASPHRGTKDLFLSSMHPPSPGEDRVYAAPRSVRKSRPKITPESMTNRSRDRSRSRPRPSAESTQRLRSHNTTGQSSPRYSADRSPRSRSSSSPRNSHGGRSSPIGSPRGGSFDKVNPEHFFNSKSSSGNSAARPQSLNASHSSSSSGSQYSHYHHTAKLTIASASKEHGRLPPISPRKFSRRRGGSMASGDSISSGHQSSDEKNTITVLNSGSYGGIEVAKDNTNRSSSMGIAASLSLSVDAPETSGIDPLPSSASMMDQSTGSDAKNAIVVLNSGSLADIEVGDNSYRATKEFVPRGSVLSSSTVGISLDRPSALMSSSSLGISTSRPSGLEEALMSSVENPISVDTEDAGNASPPPVVAAPEINPRDLLSVTSSNTDNTATFDGLIRRMDKYKDKLASSKSASEASQEEGSSDMPNLIGKLATAAADVETVSESVSSGGNQADDETLSSYADSKSS